MAKLLKITLIALIVAPIIFLGHRYYKNRQSTVPYPYVLKENTYEKQQIKAPVLLIGDRLGKRLASFKNYLAQSISENLSKPIKIIDLTEQGEALHRTVAKIKSLSNMPLITIYLGGSQEFYEQRFYTRDIEKILKNLELYEDDRIKTLLMIFPTLSKFLYHPIHYKYLAPQISKDTNNYSDTVIQKRNIIHFKLYEQEINHLFSYLKEHGSYLIALTQPLNLDKAPHKNCNGSLDQLSKEKLDQVVELVKQKDYKSAYNTSKELTLIANASAKVHFIHGKICKNLGKKKEAIKYLKRAMAYDCEQWRGNPVYNAILRKSADANDVLILDFQKMMESYWTKNILFEDEIYPQSFYYEKTANILASRIKKLLKL